MDEGLILKNKLYYQKHPIDFMCDCLDVERANVWDKMEDMGELISAHPLVTIKAGHSVSKTYTMGRIVPWFLYCFTPSTVITTAPTQPQVEQLLWREIREAHSNAKVPLGGHITKTGIDLQDVVVNGKKHKWFAYGFSTRPDSPEVEANVTKMQGYHNEYMLIIFDEADGILPQIWGALDSLLTNPRVKFVAIGNPVKPTGDFADSFSDERYANLTIAVTDTPNFKEGREVIKGLSGRGYYDFMLKKWGVDHARFKSRILGEIPDSNPDSIITVKEYERAEGRELLKELFKGVTKRFLTVDVADGGNDCTVVKGWENKCQISDDRFPGKKAEDMYGDVWRICKQIGGNAIIYDHDGVGRVLGGLLRGVVSEDIKIIGFEGSSREVWDDDFYNKRAEGHYKMYLDFRDNMISIFPANKAQKDEVTSVMWGKPKNNKMIVEPKDDLHKRLNRSPDDMDNLMMMSACYDEVEPIKCNDRYAEHAARLRGLREERNLFGGNE